MKHCRMSSSRAPLARRARITLLNIRDSSSRALRTDSTLEGQSNKHTMALTWCQLGEKATWWTDRPKHGTCTDGWPRWQAAQQRVSKAGLAHSTEPRFLNRVLHHPWLMIFMLRRKVEQPGRYRGASGGLQGRTGRDGGAAGWAGRGRGRTRAACRRPGRGTAPRPV